MSGLRLCFDLENILRKEDDNPVCLSVQTLQLLKEQGDKIFLITSKDFKSAEKWLDKYGCEYDGLFAGQAKEGIVEHWNVDLYVTSDKFNGWIAMYKHIEHLKRLP